MRRGGGIWGRRIGLLAVACVLLAGNLAFFLWYRATSRDRAAGLARRRGELEREVASREEDLARLEAQRDRLAKVSAAIEDFYTRRVGDQRKMLPLVVDEIHSVLKNAGALPSQISYSTSPLENPPLTELKVSFSFKGDYEKFKKLLAAFETDRRWIVVHEISINRQTEVPGAVAVNIGLVTYFSREREAAAPRVSLKAGAAR